MPSGAPYSKRMRKHVIPACLTCSLLYVESRYMKYASSNISTAAVSASSIEESEEAVDTLAPSYV
jgi:hypothetical protein